jgi:hypothetical protein
MTNAIICDSDSGPIFGKSKNPYNGYYNHDLYISNNANQNEDS